jgi:microcystin-dependent protein
VPIAQIPTGQTSTTVPLGNDARFSDARTPTAHTHTKANITDLGTIGTAAAKDVPPSGNASTSQVVQGDDTRLTNARTPTAHNSSHSQGQPDAISIAESQVQFLVADLASLNSGKAATAHTHAAADVSSGQLDTARLGTTPAATTYLKGAASGQNAAWVATSQVKTDLALTKSDVALASVDNTSDANKPVSTAQQTALNGKANTSHSHAESDITNLTTDLAGKAAVGHTHTPAQVGLDQVNNTSDANKPVSTAQAAADSTVQSNAQAYANTAQSNAQAFATSADAVLVPPGCVQMYAAGTPPTGWLVCDGSSVLNASYPNLFAVIGTTFGSVDSTHFSLPDMRRRFPWGASPPDALPLGYHDQVTTVSARSPQHTHGGDTGTTGSGHLHTFGVGGNNTSTSGGAGARVNSVGGSSYPYDTNGQTTTGGTHTHNIPGGAITGGSDNNAFPNFGIFFIIKT